MVCENTPELFIEKHGAGLCAVFTSTGSMKSFEFVGHSRIPRPSKPADKQSFLEVKLVRNPKAAQSLTQDSV